MTLALPLDPLVQALGWTLLHLLWQGTLVATLLAAALALLSGRGSHLRYGVSCLALALVVALGIFTGIRSYRSATPPPSAGALTRAPASRPVESPSSPVTPSLGRREVFLNATTDALPGIVVSWLAGVAFFSLRLMLEWLRLRRLITRHARVAPEPWPSVTRRLSETLGVRHVVRVVESAAVQVPSVVGLMRPAILLPASALMGLTPVQLEMILAHELAHIRRHDFLVNLLQAVVETLLFYHPAVWWISRQIRNERENCCDDLAVAACGDRLQYARALLRLEELRAESPALALSAHGGHLFERIRRIAIGSAGTRGPAVKAVGALAVLCILLAAAVPSFSGSGRSGSTPDDPSPRETLANDEASPHRSLITPSHIVAPTTRASATETLAVEPAAEAALAATPVDSGADPTAGDPEAQPEPDPEQTFEQEADRIPLDDLIAMKVHDVSPADIREMRALLPEASLRDIVSLKAVGASPAFIREMRRAGLRVVSAQEASGLAALGITRAFVREMRSVGFPVLSAQEIQGLKAVGVRGDFVRELQAMGLRINAREAQSLAALGVTAEYIEGLERAGVEIMNVSQIQSLKALGITPRFVQRLADAGYRNLSVEDLNRLGAAGVTGDFIREMSQYRSR